MIPASAPSRQPPARPPVWQRELQQAITDPAELLEAVGLGREWLEPAQAAARLFPLKVPRGYVARMRRGDPRDPLLLQVLPLDLECRELSGYVADPVGDLAARAGAGVLRKYHGRALLITTGACAARRESIAPSMKVWVPPPDSPVMASRALSTSGRLDKKSRARMLFQASTPAGV